MEKGTLFIYDNNIAVIEIIEEYTITKKDVQDVTDACDSIMVGNYGLISNRKHSYSTNPVDLYQSLSVVDRLRCLAIVAYRERTEMLFSIEDVIERSVSSRNTPMKLFNNIDTALSWMQHQLSKNPKQS